MFYRPLAFQFALHSCSFGSDDPSVDAAGKRQQAPGLIWLWPKSLIFLYHTWLVDFASDLVLLVWPIESSVRKLVQGSLERKVLNRQFQGELCRGFSIPELRQVETVAFSQVKIQCGTFLFSSFIYWEVIVYLADSATRNHIITIEFALVQAQRRGTSISTIAAILANIVCKILNASIGDHHSQTPMCFFKMFVESLVLKVNHWCIINVVYKLYVIILNHYNFIYTYGVTSTWKVHWE